MTKALWGSAALILSSTVGAAPTDPGTALDAAVTDLASRFGPAEEHRLPPAVTNPAVAADLDAIASASAQFGTPDFPVRFPETFGAVCMPLQDLVQRYLSAGLTSNDLMGANSAKATENSHRYQNALTPIMAFTFKCMALHMPGFNAFWRDLPASERTGTRREGVMQIRSGAKTAIQGLTAATVEIGITPANHKLFADTAGNYGSELASVLSLPDRRELLRTIDTSTPDFKRVWPKQYAAVRAGLVSPDCNEICQTD